MFKIFIKILTTSFAMKLKYGINNAKETNNPTNNASKHLLCGNLVLLNPYPVNRKQIKQNKKPQRMLHQFQRCFVVCLH